MAPASFEIPRNKYVEGDVNEYPQDEEIGFWDYNWDTLTFVEMFESVCNKFEDRYVLGTRKQLTAREWAPKYSWIKFSQMRETVHAIRDLIRAAGLKEGDRIAIYAKNRAEWMMTDFAILLAGCVSVPMYDSLKFDNLCYIAEHAEVRAVFCDKEKLGFALSALDLADIRLVVCYDDDVSSAKSESVLNYQIRKGIEIQPMDNESVFTLGSRVSRARTDGSATPVADGDLAWPDDMVRWYTHGVDPAPKAEEPVNEEVASLYPSTPDPVLMTWRQAVDMGTKAPSTPNHTPVADDTFTFIYTSGTSSLHCRPKCAMLSHKNYLNGILNFGIVPGVIPPQTADQDQPQSDVLISYLPSAHVFGRLVEFLLFFRGGAIGYYTGDTRRLMDDIQCLRPTVFPCVPRVVTRIYHKINDGINALPRTKRAIFNYCRKRKLSKIAAEAYPEFHDQSSPKPIWFGKDKLADALIFKKTAMLMGGRVRQIYCGSAPVLPDVIRALKIMFRCEVFEGYGMTETAAMGGALYRFENTYGHVGNPNFGFRVKLVDVGTYSADPDANEDGCPRGEICVKGDCVFKGYYKNPEGTAAVIDDDGWFHTGDVGCAVPSRMGRSLKIAGRLGNAIKLQQGEFILLEAIEEQLSLSPYLAASVVLARTTGSFVVMCCVPNWETVTRDFTQYTDKPAQLATNDDFRRHLLQVITNQLEKTELRAYERPRHIIICPDEWTVEEGLLTPSMKVVRPKFAQKFDKELDAIYRDGPLM